MKSKFKTYLASYSHDGGEWGIELQARDWADAQMRLRAIGRGRIDGELKLKIPLMPKWLAKLLGAG